MTPYIILVVAIFLFRGITLQFPERKGNTYFLILTFIYLYFFCVIRSFDVGRDIPGYIQVYEMSANLDWSNWDFIYFENGYKALMKVCRMASLTPRGFFYVIYAIILIPLYLLIKRYSASPFTSVLLYICYQLFAFNLTGIRQSIAMSICMIAFMVAMNNGKKNLLLFILLVYMAYMVHTSAIVFMFAYIAMRLPINKKTIIFYICAAVACIGLNAVGVAYVLSVFDKSSYDLQDNLRLGLSILLIVVFIVCAVYAQFNLKTRKDLKINQYCTNLLLAGLCFMFLFNGSTLLRAAMYYYFTFIIALSYVPIALNRTNALIYKGVLYSVMIVTFFTISDLFKFDLIPYEIGERQEITK